MFTSIFIPVIIGGFLSLLGTIWIARREMQPAKSMTAVKAVGIILALLQNGICILSFGEGLPFPAAFIGCVFGVMPLIAAIE